MLESYDVRTFNTLGSYAWPEVPADESVRRFRDRVSKFFHQADVDPFINDDSLRWASIGKLNELASPPACGPIMREMAATFEDWRNEVEPANWLQLIVLPPCEGNDIVRSWAKTENLTVVDPPPRDQLFESANEIDLPEFSGKGLVVIPRLENWFVRHQGGLDVLRRLIERLSRIEQHCVVGCSSWAWQYLAKAVQADLVFPTGLMFESFDDCRLRDWFEELSENDNTRETCFRLTASGQDVFEQRTDGTLKSDHFSVLAARSLGIPWVAWHLWRQSLRFGPGTDDKNHAQKFPEEETVWVTPTQPFTLPKGNRESALLILHAILIHGSMTVDQLSSVFPGNNLEVVLAALLKARFVEREGDRFDCTAASYPTVRARLASAGFPMDKL